MMFLIAKKIHLCIVSFIPCNWRMFKRLDQHKIIASAPIWLGILTAVSYIIDKKIDKDAFSFPIVLFVSSALAVMIAKAIYIVKCPDLVYTYNGYEEYSLNGPGMKYIKILLLSSYLSLDIDAKKNILREYLNPGPYVNYAVVDDYIKISNCKEGHNQAIFWYTYNLYSEKETQSLVCCYYLYLASFVASMIAYFIEFVHIIP